MTEEIIKLGFWKSKQFNHLNIDSIINIEDYQSNTKLSLSITQLTDRTAYQQKKLVDRWCDYLPTLEKVEYLWLPSRVNQKIFDAICKMKNLKGLWIKWSGIKNIDNIINLQKLEHLHLGSSSQVKSILVLAKMMNLKTIEMNQLNLISDFKPLATLLQLEGLGINGGMWTSQNIETLKFIEPLQKLRYFTMTNAVLKDKSFNSILRLENLVRFNCSWDFPESEFEKLKAHPNLKYGNVETSWKVVEAELDKQLK